MLEIGIDFVEGHGHGHVHKAVLKGGSVIATEGPEAERRTEEVLEAVRSGDARGANRPRVAER